MKPGTRAASAANGRPAGTTVRSEVGGIRGLPYKWVALAVTTQAPAAGPIFLAAAGAFFFVRLRKSGGEAVYHFRCPGCKRKLRYHARQVGHRGMCSHCSQSCRANPPGSNNAMS